MGFQGKVEESIFGEVDGVSIKQFTISTAEITLSAITWGATITNLEVPDREGNKGNVVLGFDDMHGYLNTENRYNFVYLRQTDPYTSILSQSQTIC